MNTRKLVAHREIAPGETISFTSLAVSRLPIRSAEDDAAEACEAIAFLSAAADSLRGDEWPLSTIGGA